MHNKIRNYIGKHTEKKRKEHVFSFLSIYFLFHKLFTVELHQIETNLTLFIIFSRVVFFFDDDDSFSFATDDEEA